MLRIKYKLYDRIGPQDAIANCISGLSQKDDLFLGNYPTDDWIYGEINTSSENQSSLETALANWQVVFLTDEQAQAYLDSIVPANTVVQPKLTANAASIVDGHLVKTYTETW